MVFGRARYRLLALLVAGIVVIGMHAAAAFAEPLTYMTPWGGLTAQKEAKIVQWAAERAGVEVDIQYPAGGVQGVREQLLVYWMSGVPADIVWNHQSTHLELAEKGAWLDLRPFIEADPDISVDDFVPGALDFYTDDEGRIFGIPFRWSFTVLNYNKDHFDKTGLQYPDDTWTYEGHMVEAARRLTRVSPDGETERYGLSPFRLHDFVWQAWGAELLTPDKKGFGLKTPEAISSLEFLRSLYVEGIARPGSGVAPFRNEISSMIFEHPILEHSTETLNWDIAHVPMGPAERRITRGAVGAWSIPAWSKDPEAAWKVIRELASMEGQLQYLIEGLGGTRFDSIIEFMLVDYDPSRFGSPLTPESFQNRQVYLEAMTYAEVDKDRTYLNVTAMTTLLGPGGAITKPDQPISHILDELEQQILNVLAERPIAR